ncbi:MAG: hypothetical protein IPK83_14710 [Planctomycetes bacterium]|nr:hypothetical protein [Planctomycetota bacterium]
MYQAYLEDQHETRPGGSRDSFERFLYESPTMTLEMTYRVGGRIGGIGIVDVTPACLSSVYFYFDPAFRKRRFGVLSALFEIQECRRQNLPYWYAGYYVRDCAQMKYKAEYRPFELLGSDGQWHPQDS